jgi:hypothetical protein
MVGTLYRKNLLFTVEKEKFIAEYNLPYSGPQTSEYLAKARDFSGEPLDDGIYGGAKTYVNYQQYLNDNGALFKLNPSVGVPYSIDTGTYPLAKDDPNLTPYSNFEAPSQELLDQFEADSTTALDNFSTDSATALGALGGVDIGFYNANPEFNNLNEFCKYDRAGTIESYKLNPATPLPYTPDSAGTPDPLNDPNLVMFNDVTREWVQNNFTITVDSVADFPSLPVTAIGAKVFWTGYHSQSDGGSNWGVIKSGAHVEDGGSIFSLNASTYIEANLKGSRINTRKFGLKGNSVSDDTAQAQVLIDYSETNLRGLYWSAGDYIVTNLTAQGVLDWLGESKNAVTINSTATGNLLTAIKGGPDFQIDNIDLSIKGISFNRVSGDYSLASDVLKIEKYIRLSIDDVTVFAGGLSGIHMQDCFVMRLNKIYGLACGKNAAVTSDDAVIRYTRIITGNSFYLTNSYISNSIPTNGLRINTAQNIAVRKVTLESCNKLISIGESGTLSRSVSLESVYCENAVDSHISLRAVTNVRTTNVYINPLGPRELTVRNGIEVLGTYNNIDSSGVSIVGEPPAGNTDWLSPYEFNVRTGNTSGSIFVGSGVTLKYCEISDKVTLNDNGFRYAVNTTETPLGIQGLEKGIEKTHVNNLNSVDLATWTPTGTITVLNNGGVFLDGNDVFTVSSSTGGYISLNETDSFLTNEALCFSMFFSGRGRILLRGRRVSDNLFEDVAEYSQPIDYGEMRRVWASVRLAKDYNLFICRIYPDDQMRISYPQLEKDVRPSNFK